MADQDKQGSIQTGDIINSIGVASGHMLLNYIPFLDYAAERIFLRKVGGRYIFVHRLLMEHFASLERP